MIKDSIVMEVRKIREEILESHGSIRNYHNAIMKKQQRHVTVSLPPKRIHSHELSSESSYYHG